MRSGPHSMLRAAFIAAACLVLSGCAVRPSPYERYAPAPYYGYPYVAPPLYPRFFPREGYRGYQEHEEEHHEYASPRDEETETPVQEHQEERREHE